MSTVTYITIVNFTAFSRVHVVSFEDREIVMRYTIKRRIRKLCWTSRIHSIRLYEAVLLNEEKINDKNQ